MTEHSTICEPRNSLTECHDHIIVYYISSRFLDPHDPDQSMSRIAGMQSLCERLNLLILLLLPLRSVLQRLFFAKWNSRPF
jgi:hypothetical protein